VWLRLWLALFVLLVVLCLLFSRLASYNTRHSLTRGGTLSSFVLLQVHRYASLAYLHLYTARHGMVHRLFTHVNTVILLCVVLAYTLHSLWLACAPALACRYLATSAYSHSGTLTQYFLVLHCA